MIGEHELSFIRGVMLKESEGWDVMCAFRGPDIDYLGFTDEGHAVERMKRLTVGVVRGLVLGEEQSGFFLVVSSTEDAMKHLAGYTTVERLAIGQAWRTAGSHFQSHVRVAFKALDQLPYYNHFMYMIGEPNV